MVQNKKEALIAYITIAVNRWIEDGNYEAFEMADVEKGLFIEPSDAGWDDWGVCIYHDDSDKEWYTWSGLAHAMTFAELFRYKGDLIAEMADCIIHDFDL